MSATSCIAAPPALERVQLRALARRPLRIGRSPLPTALSLLGEVLGPRTHGAPAAWSRAVRSALTRTDVAALGPVFGGERIVLPDALAPPPSTVPDGARFVTEEVVEQVAGADPARLLDEVAAEYGHAPPSAWRVVEAAPAVWLEAYAVALGHALEALEPVWRSVQPMLDRETDRVGSAVAVGAARDLLGTLHVSGRVEGDELVLERPGSAAATWDIAPDGLVLLPMLSGAGAIVTAHRDDAVTHLAYPLPGRARLLDVADEPPPDDPLAALLGARRADLLRRLDRSLTMGDLAELLGGQASTATHHVAALESAGLVARRRHGRRVLVERTARGTALLALYERA